MRTAGPPSVAILVAAGLPSDEAASVAGSAGDGGATAEGPGVSTMAATFTSTLARGASVAVAGGGAAGVSALACFAGSSGFAASTCIGSAGFSAASFSGSAGLPSGAACPVGAGVSEAASGTAAGTFSAGFSATGGSTRSSASVGGGPSFRRANIGSGVARRGGRLANSSCAARNRAAALSPKTRIDIDRTMAVNRKRKPGSMDASSSPPCIWRVIGCQGNAVTTVWPRFARGERWANQADLRVSQRTAAFCYKNLRLGVAHHPQWRFPAR